jgi:hypothetical protein
VSPSPFEASEGVLVPAEGTAPRLLLSDEQQHREAVLAYALALEHIRVASPSDSRATARYCASVVDNSRVLAGCDARLHLRLLKAHLRWLRGLKPGELS